MRLGLAIQVFFRVLFDAAFAKRLQQQGEDSGETETESNAPPAPKPAMQSVPSRSEAITLLATLQREARFVDLVREQLGDYSDEQVGAAARDVLRDCAAVLNRMFDIQPITDEEEGAEIETPAEIDAMRYRLTGNVSGEPPLRGSLVHHGWEANQCEVPVWSGSDESMLVIAPIELEI